MLIFLFEYFTSILLFGTISCIQLKEKIGFFTCKSYTANTITVAPAIFRPQCSKCATFCGQMYMFLVVVKLRLIV